MMTFHKIAAASSGKLIRAYLQENTPAPAHDLGRGGTPYLDSAGRLTSYYEICARGVWFGLESAILAAFRVHRRSIGAASALTCAEIRFSLRNGKIPGVVHADAAASRRQLRRRL
jgi:hypothetical protein